MESQWGMEEIGLAVTIAWALWINRNDVCHGKERKFGLQLLNWCKCYLEKYWVANSIPLKQYTRLEINWTPPTSPSYKINGDAAIL